MEFVPYVHYRNMFHYSKLSFNEREAEGASKKPLKNGRNLSKSWHYVGENREALAPMQGVLHLSQPVSQSRFLNLPKTADNDRTYQNDSNNLLSGQMPQYKQFESLVLESWRPCASSCPIGENNLHHPLLIGFFDKLNWMQDVSKNMLHLHVAQLLSHPKFMHHWVISYYQWQRCSAEQIISIWHWSKWNIPRLTQVKNESRQRSLTQSFYKIYFIGK